MPEERPDKPLMLYDGDCGFCAAWIARWKRLTGDAVLYAPFQGESSRFPKVPLQDFEKAVQLLLPGGARVQGADAVFKAMAYHRGLGWLDRLYQNFPAFKFISEWAYAWVASHRDWLSASSSCRLGKDQGRGSHFLSRWAFLRLLGLVYIFAFASFGTQCEGLIGSKGILALSPLLAMLRQQYGAQALWEFPGLFWLNSSDAALQFFCGAGIFFAAMLALGVLPILSLASCWLLYLTLATAGQDFMGFQWDSLLLECGLLALMLAPWTLSDPFKRPFPGSRPARWLLAWLLFRLIFSSGLVKLSSHDPAWQSLNALLYHYQTQPLPPWTAWWAQQLPQGFQRFSCLLMFAIELALPFFIFFGGRLRLAALAGLALLQILILATGNYCYFNLLTLLLCLLLIPDKAWPGRLQRLAFSEASPPAFAKGRWPFIIHAPLALLLFVLSLHPLLGLLGMPAPSCLRALAQKTAPLRSVNSYGLFAVMTTQRLEIVVQGSSDAKTWKDYEFKYKPGDPLRRPGFVAPFQPRLDWQMWFAALGRYQDNPWFIQFLLRLLQGSKPVLCLLRENPFPDGPPRYVRAQLYEYSFSNFEERSKSGAWWLRTFRGEYCPPIYLKSSDGAKAKRARTGS